MKSFKVTRDENEPKEVEFVFTFAPNAYLTNDSLILKKSFSNVQSPDSTSQITSTKVPITWKDGKNLTKIVKGAPPSFFGWFAFEGKGNEGEGFPESADIAVALADTIYPHAHKIYQESNMEESDEVDEDEDLENTGTPPIESLLTILETRMTNLMRMTAKTRTNHQRRNVVKAIKLYNLYHDHHKY